MKLLYKNSTGSYKVFMEKFNNNFYITAYSYGALICAKDINDKKNRLIITDTIDYSMTTQKHLNEFCTEFDFQGKSTLFSPNGWFIRNNKSLAKHLKEMVKTNVVRHAKNLIDFVSYEAGYRGTFYRGV